MCTVSFIPSNNSIFLTSNRDEKQWRKDALAPDIYEYESGKILFPKDADAGGTWIAAHENGNAIVFLNGGFEAHISTPPYRKSRGIILLDIIEGATPANTFQAIKLSQIEPFTAVIWDDCHLFECRWDGKEKYMKLLDENKPHIWSSVTLYNESTIKKREGWFLKWIEKNPNPSQDEILHFHQFTGDGDQHNDLKMNRNGEVFTVSVSSIEWRSDQANMRYIDLKNNRESKTNFPMVSSSYSK
ncbi:MAG: NRDE family protein [Chitinophagaceae bacterium]|nr:NRDE family protein [Chitinophagaceae bacterium]